MLSMMNRRQFVCTLASGAVVGVTACRSNVAMDRGRRGRRGRFLFVTRGKTALMNADGTGLRYLEFDKPGQVTWQPTGFFSDGRRVLLLSMEARRDGPGRPFEEYYTQTPTHLWVHDLDRGTVEEVLTKDRMAPFCTPQLILSDERLLVQVVRNKVGQVFNMRLDGSDAREFTRAGEGLPYGSSLSPDGKRVAFHLASPTGYQIWTCDLEGQNRVLVAADSELLYFGPAWSPGGDWLVYQACRYKQDPGHDWSDLCVSRPDGTEKRFVTQGQSQWFAATYGGPHLKGGGSNMPTWTRDGRILVTQRSAGAKVPWEFQAHRPDTDHFNRDYKPDLAVGGTDIGRLDPGTGKVQWLTRDGVGGWNCRPTESPDGRSILFCRARTGEMPSLWIMDADGGHQRLLTQGMEGSGADHPRWLPS